MKQNNNYNIEYATQTFLRTLSLIGIAFLVIFSSTILSAQFLDQGGITGVVTDQSGALISGAQITLTNTDTGLQLKTTTNSSGIFVFSPIQIGHYKLSASAPGMKTVTQENIQLDLQQRLNVPVKMRVGTIQQSVTVTSEPSLLQSQQSSVGQVLHTQDINNTPLSDHDWTSLETYIPGSSPTVGFRATGSIDANGLRPEQNNFVLDGMDNNAISVDYLGGSVFQVLPPPDALSQVKISTADYSAEFGHTAGALIDAGIKSGTNEIHGDLWEYWRNNILDAHTYNSLVVPELRDNIFGATLGLPIIKNKVFFFGDVQAHRLVSEATIVQSVPTLKERNGDFTELLSPNLTGASRPIVLYEPNSGGTKLLTCNGTQNVMCPGQIDAVARKIISLYPLPNANNGKTYANNIVNLKQPLNTFQWDTRVDYNMSAKDQAFARFSYNNTIGNYQAPLGPILDGSGGEGSPDVSGVQVNYDNNFVASETHVFSKSLVNEFRFAYDYSHFDTFQPNFNQNIAATLGLGNMPFGGGLIDNGGLPTIDIGSIAQAGTHQYRPEVEFTNEYQILENLNATIGNHSLIIGGSAQSIRMLTLEPPASHGIYAYSGFFTSKDGAAFTGNGIADFFANQMDSGQIGPSAATNDVQWYISGYVQDDWRKTSRLTLNLGLRYDWFEPYREMAGRQANFYPTGLPGISTGSAVLEYPVQQKSFPLAPAFLNNLAKDHIQLRYSGNPSLVNEQVLNFGPRVGFAYEVSPTIVLRSGFGMFYQGQQEGGAADNIGSTYPFVFSDFFPHPTCDPSHPPCLSDGFTMESGFAQAVAAGLSTFQSNPTLIGQSHNLKTTYAEDYNLSVQKQFPDNLAVTLAYVGTTSRHLPSSINPNSNVLITHPGVNLQPLLPFPAFGGVTFLSYTGMSAYNSLQAKIEKRMSNGLSFLATYTWSHAMDDAPEPLGGGIGTRDTNIFPLQDDYTNSNWDVRQRVTLSGLYQLPFGVGQPHMNHSGLLNGLFGGWGFSPLFFIQGGTPVSVGIANIAMADGSGGWAREIRDPYAPGGSPNPTNPTITCPSRVKTVQHWFNPCAFANPLSGDLISPSSSNGNPNVPVKGYSYPAHITGLNNVRPFFGGRSNQLYNAGIQDLDMSLFKNFTTIHTQYVQFRVDVFNALNTPAYAISGLDDGENAGYVDSAKNSARYFQLSAKYIF